MFNLLISKNMINTEIIVKQVVPIIHHVLYLIQMLNLIIVLMMVIGILISGIMVIYTKIDR